LLKDIETYPFHLNCKMAWVASSIFSASFFMK